MKKSKIIIPALGMLLLSTAASVSGTVAWFTSVQTASAEITSFAVRKVGGELGLVIKTAADGSQYGTGTKKTGEAVTLAGDQPALCDASYDHVTSNKVYKANSSATAFSLIDAEADWDIEGEDKNGDPMITYYAVSWTLEFTYTFGGDTDDVNLYFDLANAVLTGSQVTAGSGDNASKETSQGFRIAFVQGGRSVVWAGKRASGDAATMVHQSGTTTATTSTYLNPNSSSAAGTLITGAGTTGTYARSLEAVDEDEKGSAARADYIGTFTTAAPTLSVKCIAWYEGNDPTVVNGARMDTTSATMAFYTRVAE